MELQNAKARFEKQGLKVAGISYDSEAILKYFSDRRKIDFPLLSDPGSKIIRAYQVLNAEATGQFNGMARPGYFFVDPGGVIREKFFEAKYRQRLSGNNVIAKLFPELGQEVTNTVEAPHLQLALEQSDRTAFPGGRITLTAEIRLPPGVHVYAPGTKDYKPVNLILEPAAGLQIEPAVYPKSRILFLPAIKERVPVFEGQFRISQDVQVVSANDFSNSLGVDGKTIPIAGEFSIKPATARFAFCRRRYPSNGSCRCCRSIGSGLPRIFATNSSPQRPSCEHHI